MHSVGLFGFREVCDIRPDQVSAMRDGSQPRVSSTDAAGHPRDSVRGSSSDGCCDLAPIQQRRLLRLGHRLEFRSNQRLGGRLVRSGRSFERLTWPFRSRSNSRKKGQFRGVEHNLHVQILFVGNQHHFTDGQIVCLELRVADDEQRDSAIRACFNIGLLRTTGFD